jgi:acetate kinase
MLVIDEVYHHTALQISSSDLLYLIERLKVKKENEIETLKQKIEQFDQKRRAEEVAYQSLSPVRKWFAGRPASHHQAVEYMVQVKERFRKMEQIRRRIRDLDLIMERIQIADQNQQEEVELSPETIREIRQLSETEDVQA